MPTLLAIGLRYAAKKTEETIREKIIKEVLVHLLKTLINLAARLGEYLFKEWWKKREPAPAPEPEPAAA